MNFTNGDLMIFVGSLVFIILLTLTFPALGLIGEGNETEVSDLPQLNISQSEIIEIGDRPEPPQNPTSGELHYDTQRTGTWQIWIERDSAGESYPLELFVWDDDPVGDDAFIQLLYFDGPSLEDQDNHTISLSDFEQNNAISLTAGNYTVQVVFDHVDNWNTTDLEMRVSWRITDGPEATGFSTIPLLGGFFDFVEGGIAWGVWLVTIISWISLYFINLIVNVISIIIQAFFFGLSWITYIIDTLMLIVNNTSGFVSILYFIPVMVNFAMIMKLVYIFIKSLPST